jgi:hypothetical protein
MSVFMKKFIPIIVSNKIRFDQGIMNVFMEEEK